MIGPDHYREAEKLLGILTAGCDDDQEIANVLAAAQVHATLALASATALAIEPTPDAVALWDDLVLDEDAIVEHVDEDTGPDGSDPDKLAAHLERVARQQWGARVEDDEDNGRQTPSTLDVLVAGGGQGWDAARRAADDAAAVAAYDRAVEADTGRRVSLDQPCTVCGVVLGEHDDRIPSHEWIGGPR